ncbi:DUF427 domain-containing protein [Candidatus Saccharibacteria bacterium]|nr:DUF427 domain-containing protein [Candidatus Saccharibacteria bacterium]
MMQAIWNNKAIAEADKEDLIYIEGNWYFPPESLKKEYFKTTDKHTTCFWKGQASYYQIDVDGVVNEDGSWYYPEPMPSSFKVVNKDYTNYVAFWHGVEVRE